MRTLRHSDAIQGNILLPFPEEHQAFVLVRVASAERGRRWLRAVVPHVASTRRVNDDRSSGDPFVALALTFAGIATFSPIASAGLAPFVAFRAGAAGRAPHLGERGPSAPDWWRFGGPANARVDALLTLAARDDTRLAGALAEHMSIAEHAGVEIVGCERGGLLPGAMAGREHFGFRDGISQPRVRAVDVNDDTVDDFRSGPKARTTNAGEFVLGHPRFGERESAPPWPCPVWMRDGSFQVFKRLDQDVAGWRAQLSHLGQQLGAGGSPVPQELVAAKLIGRWHSGAPLALAPHRDTGAGADAEFDYDDDPFGRNTPRFAHIRKMYPRNTLTVDREWHRIIRRGVPFGPVYDPQCGAPFGDRAERGLLMNAFMASIESQFEFLMRGWANDPDFPEADDGPDPLLGDDRYPVKLRGGGSSHDLAFARFVRTAGAVYAFAPSLGALAHLARETG